MKILAEIFTGKFFYVEVEEDATVGKLKNEIGNQENLAVDRLILMVDAEGQPLLDKDEAFLKEYGVQHGSRVYIFFHPTNKDFDPESTSYGPSPFIDQKPENEQA